MFDVLVRVGVAMPLVEAGEEDAECHSVVCVAESGGEATSIEVDALSPGRPVSHSHDVMVAKGGDAKRSDWLLVSEAAGCSAGSSAGSSEVDEVFGVAGDWLFADAESAEDDDEVTFAADEFDTVAADCVVEEVAADCEPVATIAIRLMLRGVFEDRGVPRLAWPWLPWA